MQSIYLQDDFDPLCLKNKESIKVRIRVELMDSNLIPLVDVIMPTFHKTFQEYGIHNQSDPGFDTCVHALAQYFMDVWGTKAEEMDGMIGLANDNLSQICGLYADGSESQNGKYYYMYMVNNQFPMPEGGKLGYRMTNYPLQDGDQITIYANKYPYICYYAFFQEQNMTVRLGEPISVTLRGKSIFGGASIALSDAELTLLRNGERKTIDTNIITDTEGKANIVFDAPGIYTFSAKRSDISRAYVQIEVEAKEEF